MPLSKQEHDFLDAYVYEVTHGPPFGGPATDELKGRGIWYLYLSWILTAYQRELSAEGIPVTGIRNPEPPPSPWQSLEDVQRRNEILREEYSKDYWGAKVKVG